MISFSVVIPAYDEERRLPATLDTITAYLADRFSSYEVIVVDDGSRDGTAAMVERYPAERRVRLLSNPGNRGKGYALRKGMLAAKGEWVLFSDADLSTPISEVEKLFAATRSQDAVIAIGSRALDRSLLKKRQSMLRELSGKAFNRVMQLLTGLRLHDTQCGFKLYRRDAAREIFARQQLDGFSFDVEDLVIAQLLNYKVVEVPVIWSNVEGTKVALHNGLRSFADLLRIQRNVTSGAYTRERSTSLP